MYNGIEFNDIKAFVDLAAKNTPKEELSYDSFENTLKMMFPSFEEESGENLRDVWDFFVEQYFENHKEIDIVKIGENKAKIQTPEDAGSSWKIYENKLVENQWTAESINDLRESSKLIVSYLSPDIKSNGTTKGLVIGNVQSGKTANMAGVISLAADYGYNFFIVLSGTIENLRKQTSNRLFNDLNGSGNLNWQIVERPSVRNSTAQDNISNFLLSENDRSRYLTVCLKNKARLEQLKRWLFSDANKAKQLKILIIDDEADQASVNTNDIELGERTAINRLITELVNSQKVKAMNYIAYTATPYANILNETSLDSLYPKDFIVVLPQSPDYIGPSEIFGNIEPEEYPRIDIVKEISTEEAEQIRNYQKNGELTTPPLELTKAINWFLISLACLRALNYQKPISMLIHTSFKTTDHKFIADQVSNYLQKIKTNASNFIDSLEYFYKDEIIDFSRQKFIENMPGYSSVEEIPEYVEWDIVRSQLERMFRQEGKNYLSHVQISEENELRYHEGIHIAIDNSEVSNSEEHIRLVYPNKKNMTKLAPGFIVIGGNTLSRGLTIEGLVSTYFLRTTNQADTLLQMGRWFGYKKGYEIYPRLWMEKVAYQRFQFLSQLNVELREDLAMYADSIHTPLTLAPVIKNTPDSQWMRITSQSKSQSMTNAEFNFSGFRPQTVYFKNDISILDHNLNLTTEFLNSLKKPEVYGDRLVWHGIRSDEVEGFLHQYQTIEEADVIPTFIPDLIKWLKENNKLLSNWNVVLSSIGGDVPYAQESSLWDIHGYSPRTIQRSKLNSKSTKDIVSIGTLRSPIDLVSDVKLTQEERKAFILKDLFRIRENHNLGATPLLVIYRIDKDSKPQKNSKTRSELMFSQDIIGLQIVIPRFIEINESDSSSFVTKVSPIITNLGMDEMEE